jgi:hypothetical protein
MFACDYSVSDLHLLALTPNLKIRKNMKNKINTIIAIGVLVFIAMACNASFTTANISSFNFGKNEKAEPPTTTFNTGEKVYAVAMVSNTSGKHKMRFKVFYENVQGKTKGEEAMNKELDFEGARPVYLSFDLPVPGDFKVEATLLDDQGKELDKKSGTFTVKGEMPKTTEKSKDSPDSDKDSDSDEN